MRFDALRPRTPRIRRSFPVLVAGSALALLALAQCRLVDDTVTGVDISTPSGSRARANCVHGCNRQYQNARRAEEKREHAAVRECDGNHHCVKSEHLRHQRELHRIVAAMKACKHSCYGEGGGEGGH